MLARHIPRISRRPALVDFPSDRGSLALASPAPAISETSAPTLARYWPTASGSVFYPIGSAPQGGVFTFCRGRPGAASGTIGYPEERVLSSSAAGARATLGQQWSFIHEGDRLELQVRDNPHGFLIRIDNRFVSLDPHTSSGQTIFTLDFGTIGQRRIDLISWGMTFAGVYTAPTDCIFAAELRGPRALVFGDSFTTPATTNWSAWFGHFMGWDDVWPSGVGGTGFVADGLGNSIALPDRVMSDIVPYDPDLVFIHAGLNDLSKPLAQIESAARTTVRRIRENLPECTVVGGADTAFGIEAFDSHGLDAIDAIRAGLESGGAGWISPVEMPFVFGGASIGGEATLYAPVASGQAGNDGTPDTVTYPNGFTCNTSTSGALVNLRVGSTVEIGSGASRERVAITCAGYVSGKLVYGFDGAMRYAHAAGEPVREVGPCFVTGMGNTLDPKGWGSADRFVGIDSFHYGPAGHRALAAVNASLLRHHLRGRALV